MNNPIKIGISACLLGEEVRFDGGHKRNDYVTSTLSEYFEFVQYCPEIAIGLGIPRPTIRLIDVNGEQRLVDGRDSSIDHTDLMVKKSDSYVAGMPEISGYILKSRSPSCGMERVNLFNEKNMPQKKGVGVFAQRLMQRHPNLPVEEEGRLNDLNLRENFIDRVFTYYRWQQLVNAGISVSALMEFHKRHKFVLLAHDEACYRRLGPMIAKVDANSLGEVAGEYIAAFMQAMKKHASRKRHMNVLQHIMGYLKEDISSEDKQELLEILEQYRHAQLPLIVPMTLLNHHLRRFPQPYISEQYYLTPYPQELMLRNHV